MTRKDIFKASELLEQIEQLKRMQEIIKRSNYLTFHDALNNHNMMICEGINANELKILAILQIQTKIDKYNDELKQFGT